jgi:hypothetical protein
MPKSKRAKVYNLTKTSSRGREGKAALIEKVREWAMNLRFFSLRCVTLSASVFRLYRPYISMVVVHTDILAMR